MGFKINATELT